VALPVEGPDRLDLGQFVLSLLETPLKAAFLGPDLLRREVAQDLVRLRDRALDGFERFESVLLENVERPLDPLLGLLLDAFAIGPGRVGEEQGRTEKARNHQDLKRPEDVAAVRLHPTHEQALPDTTS
jgi:hypothetical protein